MIRHRVPSSFPCDVLALARAFDVSEVRVVMHREGNNRGAAELLRTASGGYLVKLYRGQGLDRSFNSMERFAVAHEIAHIVMEREYGDAVLADADEYLVERWCNLFAARVLLPDSRLDAVKWENAISLVYLIDDLSKSGGVSRPVVAKRLIERGLHACILSGRVGKNSKGQSVFVVSWSASDLSMLHVNEHSHLREDHPLGRLIIGMDRQSVRWRHGLLVDGLEVAVRYRSDAFASYAAYDVCILPCIDHNPSLDFTPAQDLSQFATGTKPAFDQATEAFLFDPEVD